jgi:hypothetical protein
MLFIMPAYTNQQQHQKQYEMANDTTPVSIAEPETLCAELIGKRILLKNEYDVTDNGLIDSLKAMGPFFKLVCYVDSQTAYHKEWTIAVFCGKARAEAFAHRLVEIVNHCKKPTDVHVFMHVAEYETNHARIEHTHRDLLDVPLEKAYERFCQAIQHYEAR